jgi:hypothetical protein
LHDEEVWIVDIKLNRLKEVLDCLLLCPVSIDKILGSTAQDNLASDTDRRIFLETDRRLLLVAIVENDRDTGLGDTCLAALVYQILAVSLVMAVK